VFGRVIRTGVWNSKRAVRPVGGGGDEDPESKHHAWNPRWGGCDDREGRSLRPEGPGPKAFEINVHDAWFPKYFQASSNIVKYNDKTNPSVWPKDYRIACKAGGADDDMFII
jgi:hypothetical protein